MQIGNGWHKVTDEGKEFISISLDEAFKTLYPALDNLNLTLWQIADKKSDKSPDWSLQIQKKKQKYDEEVPF